MKLSLPRDTLVTALTRVSRAVEKRTTMPILGNVLLTANSAGALQVTGTDLDMAVTAEIPAQIETDGAITLPAGMLLEFAKKLPAKSTLTLEVPLEHTRATLKCGRTRATLNALPAADFPTFAASEAEAARFTLPGPALLMLISRLSFAISDEETRYYLNGIHFHIAPGSGDGPQLHAVATDGHRLSHEWRAAPEGAAEMPPIILPRKCVALLRHLLSDIETVEIEASATSIRFSWPDGELASKLIDGTFPDYGRVIPPTGTTAATLDAAPLKASVDLLKTLTTDKGRALKFGFGALEETALTISVRDTDAGEATDAVPLELDGAPVEIGFNAQYVLDILAALPGPKLRVELNDPGSPARITAPAHTPETGGWEAVLMPMRV